MPQILCAGPASKKVGIFVVFAENVIKCGTFHINKKSATSIDHLANGYIFYRSVMLHHIDNNGGVSKDHCGGDVELFRLIQTLDEGKGLRSIV